MEKNKVKISWKNIVSEWVTILIMCSGAALQGWLYSVSFVLILRNMVLVLLGMAIVGFLIRQAEQEQKLDYNNNGHMMRFWYALWGGAVIAFACAFLPVSAWPFLPVFVLLALFSNSVIGIASASMLLSVSCLLGNATVDVFFLYFISGVFAVSLFRELKNEFKVGIPLFLSMLCLLVCETASVVLTANERLTMEQFLVPVANIIISSILLLGILKLFSSKVVYLYRERYLEINDTENPILAEYKETDRAGYFHCVHTAYFCERIANRLSFDADALKCAAYYHRKEKELDTLMTEQRFPPAAVAILEDYRQHKKAVLYRETAVLLCSDAVINSIVYLMSKNQDKPLDSDQVIDAVFKRFMDAGTFDQCNITMYEMKTMQKIFKEEKLYYDFLR